MYIFSLFHCVCHFLYISLYNVAEYYVFFFFNNLHLIVFSIAKNVIYICISQVYIYDKFFKNVEMSKK